MKGVSPVTHSKEVMGSKREEEDVFSNKTSDEQEEAEQEDPARGSSIGITPSIFHKSFRSCLFLSKKKETNKTTETKAKQQKERNKKSSSQKMTKGTDSRKNHLYPQKSHRFY